jgi:serine/threonine-protein kinase Chk1
LTESTTDKQRKSVDKEMRVHAALKHANVLEFLNAVVVELKHSHLYFPAIYMLMELAAGGDLFDKIGELRFYPLSKSKLISE